LLVRHPCGSLLALGVVAEGAGVVDGAGVAGCVLG
jgi:hypothetical protein